MHYGSNFFALPGKFTIVLKNGQPFNANRDGFSKIDLLQLNKIYKCATTNPTPNPTPAPTPAPTNPVDPETCKRLVELGQCGYDLICKLCKPQCDASKNSPSIILDIEGTQRCESWKKSGYCTKTYASWMAKFCMKTCFEATYPTVGSCV